MTKQEVIPVTAGAQGIAAALAKAQTEMGPALKQSNNPAFRSKYADLGNVIDACLPALNSNGIAVIQPIGEDDMGRFVKTVLVHSSGETLECRVPLIIGKNDMQGFGSAVTYARRYGLMAMAGIAPEDDDGNAAVAAAPKREEPKREQPRQESIADDMAAFSSLVDATVFAIGKQPTVAALKSYWQTLDFALQADGKVIAAKDKRKADLTREITADEIPY